MQTQNRSCNSSSVARRPLSKASSHRLPSARRDAWSSRPDQACRSLHRLCPVLPAHRHLLFCAIPRRSSSRWRSPHPAATQPGIADRHLPRQRYHHAAGRQDRAQELNAPVQRNAGTATPWQSGPDGHHGRDLRPRHQVVLLLILPGNHLGTTRRSPAPTRSDDGGEVGPRDHYRARPSIRRLYSSAVRWWISRVSCVLVLSSSSCSVKS
jgi:hypothetical protein